jgi:hypothetical protein
MKRRIIRILVGVLLAGALFGSGALGAILWHIHRSVQERCAMAQEAHPHPGDDVAALIDFMNSESHSLRERNSAIWALGRLGEAKALPALESVYTGERCEHDKKLCQYELEKAIRRCGGIPDPPRKTQH